MIAAVGAGFLAGYSTGIHEQDARVLALARQHSEQINHMFQSFSELNRAFKKMEAVAKMNEQSALKCLAIRKEDEEFRRSLAH